MNRRRISGCRFSPSEKWRRFFSAGETRAEKTGCARRLVLVQPVFEPAQQTGAVPTELHVTRRHLREFEKRSKCLPLDNHFTNSYSLFSSLCTDIVKRILILVTLGTTHQCKLWIRVGIKAILRGILHSWPCSIFTLKYGGWNEGIRQQRAWWYSYQVTQVAILTIDGVDKCCQLFWIYRLRKKRCIEVLRLCGRTWPCDVEFAWPPECIYLFIFIFHSNMPYYSYTSSQWPPWGQKKWPL